LYFDSATLAQQKERILMSFAMRNDSNVVFNMRKMPKHRSFNTRTSQTMTILNKIVDEPNKESEFDANTTTTDSHHDDHCTSNHYNFEDTQTNLNKEKKPTTDDSTELDPVVDLVSNIDIQCAGGCDSAYGIEENGDFNSISLVADPKHKEGNPDPSLTENVNREINEESDGSFSVKMAEQIIGISDGEPVVV